MGVGYNVSKDILFNWISAINGHAPHLCALTSHLTFLGEQMQPMQLSSGQGTLVSAKHGGRGQDHVT